VSYEGFSAVGRNMDHRRGETLTLGIRDDVGDATLHDGDQRIGGSEVDADDVAH
jgi:hypothetical protein